MSGKSKKAFSHNVRAEIHAGKPQKQAVAIAYSKQRQSKAEGGEVKCQTCGKMNCMAHGGLVNSSPKINRIMHLDKAGHAMAEGGEVDEPQHEMHDAEMEDELMDMACGELQEALKKGDTKSIREALKAIILSCKE